MNGLMRICFLSPGLVIIIANSTALADGYTLNWYTFDGGGNTVASTNGGFEVSGTIGQPDAGPLSSPMTGSVFELRGGFWPVTNVCNCLGDMNGDGKRDGMDIRDFVDCVLGGGNCSCADVDQANGVTIADVPVFVNNLLASNTCP